MPYANVVNRTPVTRSRIAQTVPAHVVSGDQSCKRLWSNAEGLRALRPEYIRSIANNTVSAKLLRNWTSIYSDVIAEHDVSYPAVLGSHAIAYFPSTRWICCQGCTELQSRVKYLDHRDNESGTVCSHVRACQATQCTELANICHIGGRQCHTQKSSCLQSIDASMSMIVNSDNVQPHVHARQRCAQLQNLCCLTVIPAYQMYSTACSYASSGIWCLDQKILTTKFEIIKLPQYNVQ